MTRKYSIKNAGNPCPWEYDAMQTATLVRKQKVGTLHFLSFILSAVVLLLGQSGWSQAGISGNIINESGEDVPFATVILFQAEDSTMVKGQTTDMNGLFSFPDILEGNYYLESSFVGYDMYVSGPIQFDGKSNLKLPTLQMNANAEVLEDVVVTTTRELIEVQPDKTVFNVEGSINAKGNTAIELLRKSPGVVVDNNENLMIQGKSGVLVYIDGKRSPLSGEDLAVFLNNLQSDQIDAIEVITNPSSRYDAEGNAGIINIRLIKDKNLGTNGSINTGFRYGLNPKYNASVNLNHREKWFNIFGAYSAFLGKNESSFFLTRDQYGTFYAQDNRTNNNHQNQSFRLGTDFFLNKKLTIGFLINGNRNESDNLSTSDTEISQTGSGQIDSLLVASNEEDVNRNNTNYNLNFAWAIDQDKSLNIDLDHGNFRNTMTTYQPNTYYKPDNQTVLQTRIFSNVTPTEINIYTAKADLELPFLQGQLETGLKFTHITTDNTFDNYDIVDGTRVLNVDRSNNFVYTEQVSAAYVSWKRQLGENINFSGGLRAEQTHSEGDLTSEKVTENENVIRDYLNFFPSAGFTFTLNEFNNLRVSYSRRIDRPNYQDLNPFEFKLDELSFRKGNPFLKPQYSNTYTIGHTYKGTLSSTLSYTEISDVSTMITETAGTTSARLVLVNLARQTNLALTISYPFSITDWWSVYATTTGFRLYNGANIEGDVIDLTTWSMNFYGQNTFNLPKGFKMEISGWYNSPAIWAGNWTTDTQWDLSAGISKSFFDDRGNLKVSVSDIFFTNPWGGDSEFGDLKMTGGGSWESRQVRINFSWSFGNNNVKGARRRSTGIEEESKRAGG